MLEGNNVILRLFAEEDLEEYLTLVNKYSERGDLFPIAFHPDPPTRKQFSETGWWQEDEGRLLVTDKEGRMLGNLVFFKDVKYHAGYEVGYLILRRQDRGKGYMSEALRIFSAYLFELKPIPRLQITTVQGNAAARRIAEKCGYQLEGTFKNHGFLRGRYIDVERLALLREDCPPLSEVLPG